MIFSVFQKKWVFGYSWSTPGNIEASTVVFASAIMTLPRSRPQQRAGAAEVRGPGQMREGAVAPSPILGEERVTLVTLSSLTDCQIDTIP